MFRNSEYDSRPTSVGEDLFRSSKSSALSQLLKASLPHPNEDVEFGGVAFKFDGKDKSGVILKASKKLNLPILCVFTSRLGSNSTKNEMTMTFANSVLSHPLVIETMEDLFVPVRFCWDLCGKRGEHAATFQKLFLDAKDGNEKIKNAFENDDKYPFVAVLDSQGTIITSLGGKSCECKESSSSNGRKLCTTTPSVGQVSIAMIESLLSFHRNILNPVPRYLKHLEREERAVDSRSTARAFVAMQDSWTGEAEFAQCVGVIGSKAAWFCERELLVILYDSKIISYSEIVRFAIARGRASTIYYKNDAELEEARKQVAMRNDANTKVEITRLTGSLGGSIRVETANYFLTKSKFRIVPTTDYQRCRINHAISQEDEDEAISLLSPRQVEILNHFAPSESQRPQVVTLDIYDGWKVALSAADEHKIPSRQSGDMSMLKLSKMALDHSST